MIKQKKVAIIGGGPAGLNCAKILAKNNFGVTIFEKREKLGGLMRYGIPDYRINKMNLDKMTANLVKEGIECKFHKELGKNLFLEDLKQKYTAIILAYGANNSTNLNIPGEDKKGVIGGYEALEYDNVDYNGKDVVIIGGGDVALDCARIAKKRGANNSTIIYRKAEGKMPASKKEIEAAKADGVKFIFNTNVIKIFGENKVENVECIKTIFENNILSNIEGTNFVLNTDYVIKAIGSKPNIDLIKKMNLKLTENNYISVDENYQTSMEGVFAAGDIIGKTSNIAGATKVGKEVALKVIEYINECRAES